MQDVQLAVDTVFAPFDIHRTAIVLFNDDCILGEFDDFFIGQRIAIAHTDRHIDGTHRTTGFRFFGEFHLDQLGADVTTDDRQLAEFQHRLVHIEFIRIDRTLHHGFAEAVAGSDEDHVLETGFGIQCEHHARCALVGTHHALHAG
ncbi:hypothetical protein D3C81_1538870 [compost metagenome]